MMLRKSAVSIPIYKRKFKDIFPLFVALGIAAFSLAYLTLFRESPLLSIEAIAAIGALGTSVIFTLTKLNGLCCPSCGKKMQKKDRVLIPDEKKTYGRYICYPWDLFECGKCKSKFRVRAVGERIGISEDEYNRT